MTDTQRPAFIAFEERAALREFWATRRALQQTSPLRFKRRRELRDRLAGLDRVIRGEADNANYPDRG